MAFIASASIPAITLISSSVTVRSVCDRLCLSIPSLSRRAVCDMASDFSPRATYTFFKSLSKREAETGRLFLSSFVMTALPESIALGISPLKYCPILPKAFSGSVQKDYPWLLFFFSVKMNSSPCPTLPVGRALMFPPWNNTAFFTMANPRPVPPNLRLRPLSTR